MDKYHCTSCWSEELVTTQLSGEGEVYSYTNIYVAPQPFTEDAPY
ncbi:MAG: Zn-ribbon domain-containing OB-fold protein [Bacillota bacterium]